jgi:hypothetical protein
LNFEIFGFSVSLENLSAGQGEHGEVDIVGITLDVLLALASGVLQERLLAER